LSADLILILVLTLKLTLGLDQSQVKYGLDFGFRPESSQDFSLRPKSYQYLTSPNVTTYGRFTTDLRYNAIYKKIVQESYYKVMRKHTTAYY